MAVAKERDLSSAVSRVDSIVEAGYKRHQVQPNPVVDDSTFVRRIYLNIVGRIPVAEEARRFIASEEKDKRSRLIDQLLDSPGYVSHQYNFWADILRINSRMNGQSPDNGAAYGKWVKDAIHENQHYDQFVRDLITAEGIIDQNGAVGFYLRDRGMELDHLATTVQVFLGTQLVCAQCHDHPFDEWTQMDYYRLASFSYPMNVVRNPKSLEDAMDLGKKQISGSRRDLRRSKADKGKKSDRSLSDQSVKDKTKKLSRSFRYLTENFRNSVIGETSRSLKLPHDYQYDDAEPKQVILPATPFGESVKLKEGHSRIEAYANWMTSPKNPRFTKTIANRMWKRVFGIGIFEPIDKIDDSTKLSNPELLTYLENLMAGLDYDLKDFYRVLYNTKAFSREAQSFDPSSGQVYHFPGPRLRRMSAEQVWDSLVFMIRPDAGAQTRASDFTNSSGRLDAWKRLEQEPPEALIERQKELSAFIRRTNKKIEAFREEVDEIIAQRNDKEAPSLAQKILDFNVGATSEYARLTYWEVSEIRGYFRTPFRNVPRFLVGELKKTFPDQQIPSSKSFYTVKNSKKIDKNKQGFSKEQQKNLRKKMGKEQFAEYMRGRSAKSRMRGYVRSSELPSPAPDGHFLRNFGQSDRALIENANDKASTTQALTLMNGRFFGMLMDPYSQISKEINAADDSDSMIDAVYLSILSRKPTQEERNLLRTEIAVSGDEAAESLVWSLLNTQQFLFVQ